MEDDGTERIRERAQRLNRGFCFVGVWFLGLLLSCPGGCAAHRYARVNSCSAHADHD